MFQSTFPHTRELIDCLAHVELTGVYRQNVEPAGYNTRYNARRESFPAGLTWCSLPGGQVTERTAGCDGGKFVFNRVNSRGVSFSNNSLFLCNCGDEHAVIGNKSD